MYMVAQKLGGTDVGTRANERDRICQWKRAKMQPAAVQKAGSHQRGSQPSSVTFSSCTAAAPVLTARADCSACRSWAMAAASSASQSVPLLPGWGGLAGAPPPLWASEGERTEAGAAWGAGAVAGVGAGRPPSPLPAATPSVPAGCPEAWRPGLPRLEHRQAGRQLIHLFRLVLRRSHHALRLCLRLLLLL